MQLRDYWRIIRKRWWLPLLVAVVAAGFAFGYSKLQKPTYRAEVRIGATPAKADTNLQAFLDKQLNQYKQRMLSTDFADRVSTAGSFDLTAAQILAVMKVQPLPNDGIIVVDADDSSNWRAKALADTIADVFVNDRNIENQTGNLSADNRINFQKLAAAELPTDPISPNTRLNVGAGAGLGLVLGLVLIFVLEFFNTRFDDADDVSRSLDLPTLGQIPPDPTGTAPRRAPPATISASADAGKPLG